MKNLHILKKPKAVLFDWDNTIVHTQSIFTEVIDYVLNKLNIRREDIKNIDILNQHLSSRDAFPMMFGDRWLEAKKIYDDCFEKIHLEKININQIKLVDGVIDLLEFLLKEKIVMAVVSNKEGRFLRKEVKKLNIEKYFYSIIGSCDTEYDKPSHVPAYAALNGLYDHKEFYDGIHEDNILFVGDSIADIKCAYNSKFKAILFGNDQNVVDMAKAMDINNFLIVNTYPEFLQMLKNAK